MDQLAAQAVETASQTVQTFDLSRQNFLPSRSRLVSSHTLKSEFYKVDLSGPSCSCPTFARSSGWGVKAVFLILPDASKHASSYLAVERHVEATYGQAIDSPCKQDNTQVLHPLESEPQPGFPSGNEEEPKDAGQWNKDSIRRQAFHHPRQNREVLSRLLKSPANIPLACPSLEAKCVLRSDPFAAEVASNNFPLPARSP